MITIEWGKFTAECKTVSEANKIIEQEKINMQEATIRFKIKIPGVAFDELVKDIQGSGGSIL